MKYSRRTLSLWLLAALGLPMFGPAFALETDAARSHVDGTIDDILTLVVDNRSREENAVELRRILEHRTALPQLARFTAGTSWRAMSDAQRARFTEVFSRYVAFVYAGHFRRFEGSVADLRAAIHVLRADDVGEKGVLVRSEIRPTGQAVISVDWLVSDQSGRIAVSDVVIEGISMAITQREIIGAMLEARHGDVDRLIDDLEQHRVGN